MHKILIQIGSFQISSYGFCMAAGIVLCLLMFRWLCGKTKVDDDSYNFYSVTAIVAIGAGLFGAMLFQAIYTWIEQAAKYGAAAAEFKLGGLTFMGGLIGGVAAFVLITLLWRRWYTPKDPALFDTKAERAELNTLGGIPDAAGTVPEGLSEAQLLRRQYLIDEITRKRHARKRERDREQAHAAQREIRRDFWKISEIAAPCILLAHAIGRIGCFLAGCCFGIETDSWLGVTFPGHSHAVYPTNLMESIFLFAMCGLLLTFTLIDKPKGLNLGIYAISYSIFRFLIEFIRGDHRGSFIPGLTPSQFQVILLFLAGVGLIVYKLLDRRVKAQAGANESPLQLEVEDQNDQEESENN